MLNVSIVFLITWSPPYVFFSLSLSLSFSYIDDLLKFLISVVFTGSNHDIDICTIREDDERLALLPDVSLSRVTVQRDSRSKNRNPAVVQKFRRPRHVDFGPDDIIIIPARHHHHSCWISLFYELRTLGDLFLFLVCANRMCVRMNFTFRLYYFWSRIRAESIA